MPFFRAISRDDKHKQPRKRLHKVEPLPQGELRRLYQSGKLSIQVGHPDNVPHQDHQTMLEHWGPMTVNKQKLGTRGEALGSHPVTATKQPQKMEPHADRIKRTVFVQVRPDSQVERARRLKPAYEILTDDEDVYLEQPKKWDISNNTPRSPGGHFVFVSPLSSQRRPEPLQSQAGRAHQHDEDSRDAFSASQAARCHRSDNESSEEIRNLKRGQKALQFIALHLLGQEDLWNYRVRPRVRSLDQEAPDVIAAALKNLRYKIEWYETKYEGCLERFMEAHDAPWARDMRETSSRW